MSRACLHLPFVVVAVVVAAAAVVYAAVIAHSRCRWHGHTQAKHYCSHVVCDAIQRMAVSFY